MLTSTNFMPLKIEFDKLFNLMLLIIIIVRLIQVCGLCGYLKCIWGNLESVQVGKENVSAMSMLWIHFIWKETNIHAQRALFCLKWSQIYKIWQTQINILQNKYLSALQYKHNSIQLIKLSENLVSFCVLYRFSQYTFYTF